METKQGVVEFVSNNDFQSLEATKFAPAPKVGLKTENIYEKNWHWIIKLLIQYIHLWDVFAVGKFPKVAHFWTLIKPRTLGDRPFFK